MSVTMHVNRVVYFNTDLIPGYVNPVQKDDGSTVLVDISASMCARRDELTCAVSAVRAMSGLTKEQLFVPDCCKGTALLNAARDTSPLKAVQLFGREPIKCSFEGTELPGMKTQADVLLELRAGQTVFDGPRDVEFERREDIVAPAGLKGKAGREWIAKKWAEQKEIIEYNKAQNPGTPLKKQATVAARAHNQQVFREYLSKCHLPKLLIITDGDDTQSNIVPCNTYNKKKVWPVDSDGVEIVFPRKPQKKNHKSEKHRKAYRNRLRKFCVRYIEWAYGGDIHLIGMGEEVKALIKIASRCGKRMHVGHIEDGTDAETIAKVIRTVRSLPPRQPGQKRRAVTSDTVNNRTSQIDDDCDDDDDMEDFLNDKEEAVESGDESDGEGLDNSDNDESDQDSEGLCDDNSDDEAAPSKGKKRAAPARVGSSRSKRTTTGRTSYVEASDEDDDDDDE